MQATAPAPAFSLTSLSFCFFHVSQEFLNLRLGWDVLLVSSRGVYECSRHHRRLQALPGAPPLQSATDENRREGIPRPYRVNNRDVVSLLLECALPGESLGALSPELNHHRRRTPLPQKFCGSWGVAPPNQYTGVPQVLDEEGCDRSIWHRTTLVVPRSTED